MTATLADALGIAAGQTVLLLNAPIGYGRRLGPLPQGVTLRDRRGTAADIVLVFVRDQAELRRLAPSFAALAEDGTLWVCAPQGGRGGDLDPAGVAAALAAHELSPAGSVSLDASWAAHRFVGPEDER